MKWARECTERVLFLAGNDIDHRLREALRIAKAWENNRIPAGPAMKASLQSHAAARETDDPGRKAIARSAGQTTLREEPFTHFWR
jgi:hypothetical protein